MYSEYILTTEKRSSEFEARTVQLAAEILATLRLSFHMGVQGWYFIASRARLEFVKKTFAFVSV